MIDITKEEFWENDEEITKLEKRNSRVKEFISNHKIISLLIVSLISLITVNTILIYNFYKILINIY